MYKRADVKWREEGDDVIIFCPRSSNLFRLNETGKAVWKMVEEFQPEEITAKITAEYEADKEEVLKDVKACLNDLLSKQLIVEAT